jgi:Arylsulfatase A and related enzymes
MTVACMCRWSSVAARSRAARRSPTWSAPKAFPKLCWLWQAWMSVIRWSVKICLTLWKRKTIIESMRSMHRFRKAVADAASVLQIICILSMHPASTAARLRHPMFMQTTSFTICRKTRGSWTMWSRILHMLRSRRNFVNVCWIGFSTRKAAAPLSPT